MPKNPIVELLLAAADALSEGAEKEKSHKDKSPVDLSEDHSVIVTVRVDKETANSIEELRQQLDNKSEVDVSRNQTVLRLIRLGLKRS